MPLFEELERSLENDGATDDGSGGGGRRRKIKVSTYTRTIHAQLLALRNHPFAAASSTNPTNWNRAYLGAGARAESILERMVNRHRRGLLDASSNGMEAVTHAFNYVLLVYSKYEGGYGAAARSKKLFKRLVGLKGGDNARSGGVKGVYPDAVTYGAYLTTLSRSDAEDAGEIAWDLLKRIERQYKRSVNNNNNGGGNRNRKGVD